MSEASETLSFGRRLRLAWRLLTDGAFAAKTLADPAKQPAAPVSVPSVLQQAPPDAALQLLGLLQQEGRLIDFLQEDVDSYSDADIGAAARVVHQGCSKVLNDYFSLAPVSDKQENQRLTLTAGFDPARYRLTGNVVGQPPFSGTLVHRGWQATDSRLPKLSPGHDVSIIAPAEVEL